MRHDWTPETLDESETAMHETDQPDRQRDETGPGLLTIVDAGELDMDALATAVA